MSVGVGDEGQQFGGTQRSGDALGLGGSGAGVLLCFGGTGRVQVRVLWVLVLRRLTCRGHWLPINCMCIKTKQLSAKQKSNK